MTETFLLFVAFLVAFGAAKRSGALAPASFFALFAALSSATFYIVHSFEVDADDILFSAMPLRNFDDVATFTMVHYLLLVVLGWISGVGLRPQSVTSRVSILHRGHLFLERTLTGWAALNGFFLLVLINLLHFLELDKSMIWLNYEYLAIKTPESIGITSILGRLYHFAFRPIGLICFCLAIYYLKQRKYVFFLASGLISLYSITLLLAGNSRWVPLYFFCGFAVSFTMQKRKFRPMNVVLLILMFVSFFTVLIGRSQTQQGLSQLFTYMEFLGLVSFEVILQFFIGFIMNVSDGAIGLANAVLIGPRYAETFKILSLSPLISAIDNYDSIRQSHLVKINPYVPISAFGEVLHFGWQYMFLFYIVVFFWLRIATRVYVQLGGFANVLFAVPSYWLIFALHQYSTRTSWRWIIVLTLTAWAINRMYGSQTGRQRRIRWKRPAAETAQRQ